MLPPNALRRCENNHTGWWEEANLETRRRGETSLAERSEVAPARHSTDCELREGPAPTHTGTERLGKKPRRPGITPQQRAGERSGSLNLCFNFRRSGLGRIAGLGTRKRRGFFFPVLLLCPPHGSLLVSTTTR